MTWAAKNKQPHQRAIVVPRPWPSHHSSLNEQKLCMRLSLLKSLRLGNWAISWKGAREFTGPAPGCAKRTRRCVDH
jgi:hypothetical protein